MGKIKLTLSIEEAVIIQAKNFAKQQRASLSEVIQDFLKEFSKEQEKPLSKAQQMRGMAKSDLSDKTDAQIKEMMYKERYEK